MEPSPPFGERDRRDPDHYGERPPPPARDERECQRKDAQRDDESFRTSELVVCLANALRPEMRRSWREARDEQSRQRQRLPAGSLDSADKLEILEEHLAIVSPRTHHDRAFHRKCS